MVSFPPVSPPKPCIHLTSPPYALHAMPISFDHPKNIGRAVQIIKTIIHQLQVLVNRCIRRILKIFCPVQISNQGLWARAKQRPIELEIRHRKWGVAGPHTSPTTRWHSKSNPRMEPPGNPTPEADFKQHGAEQSSNRHKSKTANYLHPCLLFLDIQF